MHSLESLREIRALEYFLGNLHRSYEPISNTRYQRERRMQVLRERGEPICIIKVNLATRKITFEDLIKKDVASLTTKKCSLHTLWALAHRKQRHF